MKHPFHIVIQARDLSEARRFYCTALGAVECRAKADSLEFNLYGHHLVCQLNPALGKGGRVSSYFHSIEAHGLPVPRCGVVLELGVWRKLVDRLVRYDVDFIVEPFVRCEGHPSEEAMMVLHDPSGNGLEFKSFRDIDAQLFGVSPDASPSFEDTQYIE